MSIAVVLAAGAAPDREQLAPVADASLVVAADGGLAIARRFELPIHAVVGDLDSASDEDVAWANEAGAEIMVHSTAKDATDLELAMAHADRSAGIEKIIVFGIGGGRLDHEMGNWAVCCASWRSTVEVHTAGGVATILRSDRNPSIELWGQPGQAVSLIARTGAATGVNASGVRWPLQDATLEPDSSLGISNEFTETEAHISVGGGVLIVVRPTSG